MSIAKAQKRGNTEEVIVFDEENAVLLITKSE